ncbi:MAG TPA: SDR family oxidoreductase [Myxococcales bacterium]|nr:SDR family oxidoreductase [Myxococcales bacterium]
MDLGLAGKSVLLIGAGRGLGGAAAVAIAHETARVAVMARSKTDVEAKAAECRRAGARQVLAIAGDATDDAALKAAVEQTVQEFGGLDALVPLVGGSQPGGTADLSGADWEAAFARNLWPSVRASRHALPHLIAGAVRRGFEAAHPAQVEPPKVPREPGVILHVSSIFGREGGGSLSYNTAKAALLALAHEQARELAPRGVRVLSLAPGSILHPGGSWEKRLEKDPAGTTAFVQREIPFGRFGTAEEVGDVIAFLVSPRASWMAGACVVVDGGQSRSF